jgi:hypothetical protein
VGKYNEVFFEEIDPEILERMPEWFKILRREMNKRSNKLFRS